VYLTPIGQFPLKMWGIILVFIDKKVKKCDNVVTHSTGIAQKGRELVKEYSVLHALHADM